MQKGEYGVRVYDFDNTILRGDSTALFVRYAFVHYPRTRGRILRALLRASLLLAGRVPLQQWKQELFSFFACIPDRDAAINAFWQEHLQRIQKWYLEQKQLEDVVISASPQFLIEPACRMLGVSCVMGSLVDPATGLFQGKNCKGEEKVHRFRAAFGDAPIHQFYSDSLSDTPLAACAQEAFLVRGALREPWPFTHV